MQTRLSTLLCIRALIDNLECSAPIGKSDHALITFECDIEFKVRQRKEKVFLYEKGDYDEMCILLDLNWVDIFKDKDIEEVWSIFKEKVLSAIDKCIPVRVFKENSNIARPSIINKIESFGGKLKEKVDYGKSVVI